MTEICIMAQERVLGLGSTGPWLFSPLPLICDNLCGHGPYIRLDPARATLVRSSPWHMNYNIDRYFIVYVTNLGKPIRIMRV